MAWTKLSSGAAAPRGVSFLHVDDMAAASLFVLNLPKQTYDENTDPMLSHINVGTGVDISIFELAQLVAKVTGFRGKLAPTPQSLTGRCASSWMWGAWPNGVERRHTARAGPGGYLRVVFGQCADGSDVRKQIR